MTDIPDIERLRRQTGVKWNYFDEDVLPAWVADMDLPTAPVVSEALRTLVDDGDLGYNTASFDRSVLRAWIRWSARRFSWHPDVRRVRMFADVLQPISAVLSVATEPDDGIVLFTPIYPPFFRLIEKSGRRIVECQLDEESGRIVEERFRSSIDETTRAIILCNPQNPRGTVMDDRELALVADVAEERDLLVISDEIWQDVVYPGATHVPFASLSPSTLRRTVTVTSASKSFNLGGLCCAVAHVGPEAVWEALEALPPHLLGPVNAFGAHAALAAWTEGDAWLDETLEVLLANRDHLATRLRAELPQVGFAIPEATYLAWLDFRRTGLGADPATHLLEAGRVGLSPGPEFGRPGEGFARLNFATSRELLDEIVDRLVAATGT
jgi:cystathionine beta-lyase